MNLQINIITALRALRRNKMRSILTSIGIIIGISSVIAMIGLGSSARIAVRERVFSYGINAMFFQVEKGKKISPIDLERLKQYVPQIKYITPATYNSEKRNSSTHQYKGKKHRAAVYFTNQDYFPIQGRVVTNGRIFTENEIRTHAKVAVIGTKVRDSLFNMDNPIGKNIWLKGTTFRVIGVLDEKGEALSGRDFDNITVIPYTVGLRRFQNVSNFREVYVSSTNENDLPVVKEFMVKYFVQKFSIIDDQKKYFTISTSQDKLQMADDITNALSVLLAGIASISLFVGGVGIMNIMLVSVTERTREIGIRMAIGAKKSDIMLQFLLESIVLSSLGGVIGVILGLILYYVITIVTKWPFIFSLWGIAISVFFAAAVGIFFGYYPSKKASDLKPIEALRFE